MVKESNILDEITTTEHLDEDGFWIIKMIHTSGKHCTYVNTDREVALTKATHNIINQIHAHGTK